MLFNRVGKYLGPSRHVTNCVQYEHFKQCYLQVLLNILSIQVLELFSTLPSFIMNVLGNTINCLTILLDFI